MTRANKWGSRVVGELKLVWLVVEDIFFDILHPADDASSATSSPCDFNTMTVTQLVRRLPKCLAFDTYDSQRCHFIACVLAAG